jgi:hypothetical protein
MLVQRSRAAWRYSWVRGCVPDYCTERRGRYNNVKIGNFGLTLIWLDPARHEIVDDTMAEALRGKIPGQQLAMLGGMWQMARDLIRDKRRQDHPE